MVVVVCCGTGNWLGVGLHQCSYFVHKSQSADERQTTHKNVYLCLGGKKSQIHKFSWWFVICVLDFWVCSSSILFFGCATHTIPMWLHFWWCHNHTPFCWICDKYLCYKSEFTLNSTSSDIFGHSCSLNIHPLRPGQNCATLWDYLRGLSPAWQVLSFEQRQLQLKCSFG